MKYQYIKTGLVVCLIISMISCKDKSEKNQSSPIEAPEGMVWVPKKQFIKGAKEEDKMAMKGEKPAHKVEVDGFFIDKTEVTNAQFAEFVAETEYITLAERPIDWEEMKEQLPPGTPKPHDSILAPGSLIFNKAAQSPSDMNNYHQWWKWEIGANWRHPEGEGSSIEGKENYPVVHIAFEDALAYCEWANRRLPTEAEWESAALGEQNNTIFTWGNDMSPLNENANTWQGEFPVNNEAIDGFEGAAPVKSFPPNSIGLYDMMGNVWELTSGYFNVKYYESLDQNKVHKNPTGAESSFNPNNPYETERIIKGGSFLCHDSYCASFRISARMGNAEKSSSDHVGFRTVATPEMLETEEQ
jgi:formylglycine-generating enzyme required for sulfatase activity